MADAQTSNAEAAAASAAGDGGEDEAGEREGEGEGEGEGHDGHPLGAVGARELKGEDISADDHPLNQSASSAWKQHFRVRPHITSHDVRP